MSLAVCSSIGNETIDSDKSILQPPVNDILLKQCAGIDPDFSVFLCIFILSHQLDKSSLKRKKNTDLFNQKSLLRICRNRLSSYPIQTHSGKETQLSEVSSLSRFNGQYNPHF